MKKILRFVAIILTISMVAAGVPVSMGDEGDDEYYSTNLVAEINEVEGAVRYLNIDAIDSANGDSDFGFKFGIKGDNITSECDSNPKLPGKSQVVMIYNPEKFSIIAGAIEGQISAYSLLISQPFTNKVEGNGLGIEIESEDLDVVARVPKLYAKVKESGNVIEYYTVSEISNVAYGYEYKFSVDQVAGGSWVNPTLPSIGAPAGCTISGSKSGKDVTMKVSVTGTLPAGTLIAVQQFSGVAANSITLGGAAIGGWEFVCNSCPTDMADCGQTCTSCEKKFICGKSECLLCCKLCPTFTYCGQTCDSCGREYKCNSTTCALCVPCTTHNFGTPPVACGTECQNNCTEKYKCGACPLCNENYCSVCLKLKTACECPCVFNGTECGVTPCTVAHCVKKFKCNLASCNLCHPTHTFTPNTCGTECSFNGCTVKLAHSFGATPVCGVNVCARGGGCTVKFICNLMVCNKCNPKTCTGDCNFGEEPQCTVTTCLNNGCARKYVCNFCNLCNPADVGCGDECDFGDETVCGSSTCIRENCNKIYFCGDCTVCTVEPVVGFMLGDVNGSEKVDINDAVEILCYLAKLNSRITVGTTIEQSRKAALIKPASVTSGNPAISDAVDILCYLAKLDGVLTRHYAT